MFSGTGGRGLGFSFHGLVMSFHNMLFLLRTFTFSPLLTIKTGLALDPAVPYTCPTNRLSLAANRSRSDSQFRPFSLWTE